MACRWSGLPRAVGAGEGWQALQAKQTVYTNVGQVIRGAAPQAEASVNSGATGGIDTQA